MKTILHCLAAAVLLLGLLSSCASQKDILYFQDIDEATIEKISKDYEPVIKRDDVLRIIVSGPEKSVVMPYNLTLTDASKGSTTLSNPTTSVLPYQVDNEGYITFPNIGRIFVLGMTRKELVDYLTKVIGKDVEAPIVYVAFENFKVTVLGEVRNPGTFNVASERLTLLQALGMAGDLTLTAQRKGLILIREVDGKQTHFKFDLTDSQILSSPFFYLQQNDVIYVPASPSRVAAANTNTGIWSVLLSTITTLITIITFSYNVLH
ncbi:MAG: polysaccharide biosynthesis/export family protein [Bacteroidales bacterium]|nr:polysaccharide biosynthesis/export family protein [Bacteroidales bacterium]MBQ7162364.1 polysaccharide biosynthesis/export family protein [Bacteroidales bacterium]